ncbi:GH21268 [Drosophila grimshawi]|uniref:GH21268 n=1 Tax=Drosophila grimshawi TaxID=7222 RepID=B4J7T1_DROGR|nr:GH21268 [Drosophila grimshawi]
MFNTTLGVLVSWLAQGLCLLIGQVWEHPLLTTGICLLFGFFHQTDELMRHELNKKLLQRFRSIGNLFSFSLLAKSCNQVNNNGYSSVQGANSWTLAPADANQSPINIDEQIVQRLAIRELLNWNHYDELPASIQLENTGQTLLLRAKFRSNVPTVSGADLLASYTFVELCFHWGWSNSEGSEHTFNNRKFPLEMQVLHRTGAAVPKSCTSSYDLLMIAYVFELSAHNPFLDPLMQNLKLVQQPGKRVQIAPFPLSYLVYPFRTGFYSYGGSLTKQPCYQGTEWFIFPESLAISDFQLRHFRQLLSGDGVTPISRNSRPVQPLGNRVINLNYFCPYDATQLARMQLNLLQQHDQEQQHMVDEHQQQQELKLDQKQTQLEQEVLQKKATATCSDDEGQLIETLETTTTITNSSHANMYTTILSQQELPSFCPDSIILFTNNNNSNDDQVNSSDGDDHYQQQQQEQTGLKMLTPPGSVAICGMGDGLNVGLQMIE